MLDVLGVRLGPAGLSADAEGFEDVAVGVSPLMKLQCHESSFYEINNEACEL